MALFSLSPAVTVKEWDLSQNVPAIPSARTGAILRADTGPALKIVSITNENELVNTFGKPTTSNYQDWFQCWNFLQYASSLYVVRPIDANKQTGNATLYLTSQNAASGTIDNMYNISIAEATLAAQPRISKIAFINRFVTSQQKLAVAVCSEANFFENPIAVEFSADISSAAISAVTGNTIAATNVTLVAGSKVLLGTTGAWSKVATIESVSATGVKFVTAVTSADFVGMTKLVGINLYNTVYADAMILKSQVTLADKSRVYVESLPAFSRFVEFAPDWTKDQFEVVVLEKDDDGKYDLKEVKIVSYLTGGKDSNGRNNFAEEAFFAGSSSLYCTVNPDPIEPKVNTTVVKFADWFDATNAASYVYPATSGGAYDGFGYTKGDIQIAQDLFADPESFDVNILISHTLDINGMAQIAENRKDCIAVVAPLDSAEITYMTTNGNSDVAMYLMERYGTQQAGSKTFDTFGTYSAIYGNAKYQYDKFNDVNRWISVVGDVAGLYAQTDSTRDTWWAPAGSERGKVKNVVKLAFNPNKQNRDDMYVNAINPIISIAGEGAGVVYGQKTATAISSAMDRVNVRRLLIFLEKSIATAARTGLFEFNDAFTRSRLFGQIEPFLRTVQSRRGLYDYKLVIDESNNTPEIIDQNGLVIDVYVKPARVAEFINVNAVIVKTGVSFSEVVGRFGG